MALYYQRKAGAELPAILGIAREKALSRLLMAYAIAGLAFMLLPGTFLGVWNLLSIAGRKGAQTISPAWLQAHGHAQVFGWIGGFILGIGFYSIPKLRGTSYRLAWGWVAWSLWNCGVLLRWAVNVYGWHWRVALPLSAALELAALLIFLRCVAGHRSNKPLEAWIIVVATGTLGFATAVVANLIECIRLARTAGSPAFPAAFDQRFLMLLGWGFMALFVWGFSARWLPVFAGLRAPRNRTLLAAVATVVAAVVFAFAGELGIAVVLLVPAALLAITALGVAEPSERPAKVQGIHPSFPYFVRLAYAWLLVAAGLSIFAWQADHSGGIWGASRHALTVGFIATMVFCIAQRVLPAFSGMRLLFRPWMMFTSLLCLSVGCFLRVTGEVLAYQEYAHWAWNLLPVSAILELLAVTVFAVNLFLTFANEPPVVVFETSPA